MSEDFDAIWVYLSQGPLFWLITTLLVFTLCEWLYGKSNQHPLANPVLLSIAAIVLLLLASGTDYRVYFSGAQFIHFLLGPATVAIAIPIFRSFRLVVEQLLPLTVALITGATVGIGAAVYLAELFGLSEVVRLSAAPKSVTTPIAMAVAEKVNGDPSLAAVLVILSGVTGAVVAPPLLRLMGIRNESILGFSMGVASHGIGTARAFQISDRAGSFSGLAMGLNGALTALLVPYFLLWMGLSATW